MEDIVIDTNVFVDANNPDVERFRNSVEFLNILLLDDVQTTLKVDPGLSNLDGDGESRIIKEYLDHVTFGSLSYSVLVYLFNNERVSSINSMPEYRIKRKINQLIKNKMDRYFLCVAMNSDEGVLVSHDYVDFQIAKRRTIKRDFGVDIIEAEDAQLKF